MAQETYMYRRRCREAQETHRTRANTSSEPETAPPHPAPNVSDFAFDHDLVREALAEISRCYSPPSATTTVYMQLLCI